MSEGYLFDGVWVYARDDRGPFRLAHIECGERVGRDLWAENQPRRREDRQRTIEERCNA